MTGAASAVAPTTVVSAASTAAAGDPACRHRRDAAAGPGDRRRALAGPERAGHLPGLLRASLHARVRWGGGWCRMTEQMTPRRMVADPVILGPVATGHSPHRAVA